MRREFSAKVKLAAFQRSGGHCEKCTRKLFAGDFHYDHTNPDGLGGSPDLDNCAVLCRACHAAKTKNDVRDIAKSNRIRKRRVGIKKPRTMTRWRKFDGTVVQASRER